ncbi:MAG: hypothetical protein JWN98_2721 [Abditibacteriota bacterium]|nr:hypothetical protein [Abditibacteriota bacterium]
MNPQSLRSRFETEAETQAESAENEVVAPPQPEAPGEREARRPVLPAAQWLRVMTGFDAPFGHDGLPTVWG